MMKPKIYVTRKLSSKYIEKFEDNYEIKMWHMEEEPVPREILIEEIKDTDALFCLISEKIDEELLKNAQQLKVISNMAVGFDNIDIMTAKELGIIITNTPDVLTETTADLTFGLLMATARRLVEANNYIKENRWTEWAPFMLAGSDIHHKTIGIVGMGRIGEAVARRAKGFGMNIIYHNRNKNESFEKEVGASYVSLDDLVSEADFIVSLLPLTSQTENIFNKRLFDQMKRTAIFINASRGGVVNEQDLYHTLKNNKIAGAGLDVFKNEPITNDHPLMSLDNILCLPHIGSASIETREAMICLCLNNIDAVLSGKKPLTEV